jgi:hypothetical protein
MRLSRRLSRIEVLPPLLGHDQVSPRRRGPGSEGENDEMLPLRLHCFRLGATALASLLGAGLSACSSNESPNADGGLDGASTADAGGTDATTGTDSATPFDGASETGADAGADTAADSNVTPPSTICLADGGTNAVGCCVIGKPAPSTTTTIIPRPGAMGANYAWNDPGGFAGFSFSYGNGGTLNSDVSGGNWHLTGAVADFEGFNLGFNCMVDASLYKGIKFTISGNIAEPLADGGTVSRLTFWASTAADDFQDGFTTSYARCIPMTGNRYDGECQTPRATVAVPAAPTTYSFLWSDLMGGRAVVGGTSVSSPINPAELTGIFWTFDWVVTSPDGGVPTGPDGSVGYPVDVTISDVSFITSLADGGTSDGAPPDGSSEASADGPSEAASGDGPSTD